MDAACESSMRLIFMMMINLHGVWGSIHDLDLEWVPASERTSGRSTPSSSTLGGNKPVLHDKVTSESDINQHRSVSSKSAHCWGYIQGICPHSETCKYLHPADIAPCASFLIYLSKFADHFMSTGCRYKIHAVSHLAALRLSDPRLPAKAPSGRQT